MGRSTWKDLGMNRVLKAHLVQSTPFSVRVSIGVTNNYSDILHRFQYGMHVNLCTFGRNTLGMMRIKFQYSSPIPFFCQVLVHCHCLQVLIDNVDESHQKCLDPAGQLIAG
jgi:hypothetical protein